MAYSTPAADYRKRINNSRYEKQRHQEEKNTSTKGRGERTNGVSKAKRLDGFPAQIAAENIARASTHGGGGSGGCGAEHICFLKQQL